MARVQGSSVIVVAFGANYLPLLCNSAAWAREGEEGAEDGEGENVFEENMQLVDERIIFL